ncbi:hypothetical protein [Mucilaginibacter pallidiroseus]|nr:hypothetical protein [Mucilaginibacter pallidiroseus]
MLIIPVVIVTKSREVVTKTATHLTVMATSVKRRFNNFAIKLIDYGK